MRNNIYLNTVHFEQIQRLSATKGSTPAKIGGCTIAEFSTISAVADVVFTSAKNNNKK